MDGVAGTASYEVDIPDGGSVILRNNMIEKGPNAGNQTAVSIGEESNNNPTTDVLIGDNTFINDSSAPATFVRNMTPTVAQLTNNVIHGQVILLTGPGQPSP